ncbi:hypothetical protein BH10ACT10_BH10ACT10_01680 [soil metagenome]
MTAARRNAGFLLVGYSIFLAWALFWPSSSHQSGAVLRLQEALAHLPLPTRVEVLMSYERLEVVMNAVIIAPVTFLASVVFPGLSWRDWTAGAFVASATVEAFQGLALPGRHAAFSDVVANTVGALAGALLVALARSMLRARKSR